MASAPGFEVESSPLERDDIYYFHAVFFQAEDRIFQVPSYHFAQNSQFLDAIAQQNQQIENGLLGETSEEVPLQLEGVSKVDFQKLLEVMHPLDSVTAPAEPTRTKDSWVSILRLATKWGYAGLRALAISKLNDELKDPTERILLGRAFGIPRWLYLGYKALVMREAVVSLEEAESINYPTAIHLLQIREEIQKTSMHVVFLHHLASDAIKRKFWEELSDVEITETEQESQTSNLASTVRKGKKSKKLPRRQGKYVAE